MGRSFPPVDQTAPLLVQSHHALLQSYRIRLQHLSPHYIRSRSHLPNPTGPRAEHVEALTASVVRIGEAREDPGRLIRRFFEGFNFPVASNPRTRSPQYRRTPVWPVTKHPPSYLSEDLPLTSSPLNTAVRTSLCRINRSFGVAPQIHCAWWRMRVLRKHWRRLFHSLVSEFFQVLSSVPWHIQTHEARIAANE
jgi:hypothetical protein